MHIMHIYNISKHVFHGLSSSHHSFRVNLGHRGQLEVQFKRYKDAKGTARALAKPKYEGMQKVGPSDQSAAGGFQACIWGP